MTRLTGGGLLAATLVACAQPGAGGPGADEAGAPAASLAVRSGALEGDGPTTIPYGGYVDFDGEPVNASGVKFNFAIFPCATPGTGAGQCAPLWVAVGDWGTAADWKLAWPANASVTLPIFSGRFTVELGGAGQTALPAALFDDPHGALYLGVQVEGRALGTLQKLAPAARSRVAAHAFVAEEAVDFIVRNDLTVEGALLPQALVLPDDTRASLPDASQHEGELRYLADEKRLVVSDGTDWQPRLGTRHHPALDCAELRDAGETGTGIFWITGISDGPAYPTECRNDLHGGGWNLLIRGDLNTTRSPLSWYYHTWWDSFGALGGPSEAVWSPGYSGVLPWSQLLVVKQGATDSMILSDTVRASFFSGGHTSLTASQVSAPGVVGDGAVFAHNQVFSGNGIVGRQGRWLTGGCDGTECFGAHGFGVSGSNHASSWYAQATSMFQSFSYNAGSPESIAIYAR